MPVQLIQIIEKSFFTDDILRLRLGAETPIAFEAGQYILLGLDANELKPFSIAIAPDDSGELELHIRKNHLSPWMQKLFSKAMGDSLYWQGPTNHIRLADKEMPTILVAGGTGFALVKALLEELLKTRPTCPIHLYWGVRQATELYLHDWLLGLCQQYKNLDYTHLVSEADIHWQGKTGYVHEQVLRDFPILKNYVVYLCGPPDMQIAAKKSFLEAGLPESQWIA